MTPDRFQQIRNVFEAALERGAGRGAFLGEACGGDVELRQEVDRLIEAHESTITMGPDSVAPASAARTDPSSREGRRIGDYEVLRELGQGGMGSVYLARRADAAFQKNVAIKILRADVASTDVVQRFHREREILAQLDHPNIARLLDAGETDDGLPYFVLEYVEGRSINGYADDKRLSVRDRIELFRQVCDAVEYAHQRKIVHRDLKPGNVLVTSEGQVKLLDFGIARLLEKDAGMANLTRSGMWLMTPEYASPEQVRGEAAGRASDVYSLGVILFELLTGHRPYHMKSRIFHEVVRIVCEEPPTRPSTVITRPIRTGTSTLPPETAGRLRQTSLEELKRQLTGNLDNIVLKALEKQPQDRYASALQFRKDIDRHLNAEPVWARGHLTFHRMGHLLYRYRVALVAMAAIAAAIGSGAASMRLLWWIAGAAGLMLLWHAASDREVGRMLATRPWVRGAGLIIFSVGSANLFLGKNESLAMLSPVWREALYYGLLCVGPLLFVRWRGGPTILKLDTPTNLKAFRGVSLLAAGLVLLNIPFSAPYSAWPLGAVIRVSSLLLLALLAIGPQIRRDGFAGVGLGGGSFVRWSRIASWNWIDEDEPKDILVLHLHHRIQFLTIIRMRLSKRLRPQVASILAQQLGEWPGGEHSVVSDEIVLPSPRESQEDRSLRLEPSARRRWRAILAALCWAVVVVNLVLSWGARFPRLLGLLFSGVFMFTARAIECLPFVALASIVWMHLRPAETIAAGWNARRRGVLGALLAGEILYLILLGLDWSTFLLPQIQPSLLRTGGIGLAMIAGYFTAHKIGRADRIEGERGRSSDG